MKGLRPFHSGLSQIHVRLESSPVYEGIKTPFRGFLRGSYVLESSPVYEGIKTLVQSLLPSPVSLESSPVYEGIKII